MESRPSTQSTSGIAISRRQAAVAAVADVLLAMLVAYVVWLSLVHLTGREPLLDLLQTLHNTTPARSFAVWAQMEEPVPTQLMLRTHDWLDTALLASLSLLLRGEPGGRAEVQALVLSTMFLALAHAERWGALVGQTGHAFSAMMLVAALGLVAAARAGITAKSGESQAELVKRLALHAGVAVLATVGLAVCDAALPLQLSWGVALLSPVDYVAPAMLFASVIGSRRRWGRAKRIERRAAQEAEVALLEAQAAAAHRDRDLSEARLQELRSQVEPHFLWNTLANLEYLIQRGHASAAAMARDLQSFLRRARPQARGVASTLGAEIEAVRAYLALLQLRLGSRLQFALEFDAVDAGWRIPPLVLHTLVENAVEHGLRPRTGPGCVTLRVARTPSGQLRIAVIDDGVGLGSPSARPGSGIGLRSVRAALRECFGDAASFSLHSQPEGGTCAVILAPMALA